MWVNNFIISLCYDDPTLQEQASSLEALICHFTGKHHFISYDIQDSVTHRLMSWQPVCMYLLVSLENTCSKGKFYFICDKELS